MKTCILIGGGKSILEGIQTDLWKKIKGQDIWSINYAFLTMPYLPTKQIWVDTTFFRNNISRLEELNLKSVELITKANPRYNGIKNIVQYDTTREQDTAIKNPNKLYIGHMGLSGTFAIALACKLNYDYVYLLGFDFGTSNINDKHTHYYQYDKIDYISSGVNNPNVYMTQNSVKKDVNDYDFFKNLPTKIYNISPQSNIQSFEKLTYPQFYKQVMCDKIVNLIQNT
jgi:hypothetical protein